MIVKVVIHYNQQSFFGEAYEIDNEGLEHLYDLLAEQHVMKSFALNTPDGKIFFPAQIIQQSLIEVIVKE